MRRANRSPRACRCGYSLIELSIAMVLFAIVLGSLAMVSRTSDRMFRTGTVISHLESQVKIATDRFVRELRIAGVDTIDPDPAPGVGGSDIRYVQAVVGEFGEVEWTPIRRLFLEYESGEVNDGIDNNGNGLVDEGRVVLVDDFGGANERRLVLTRWVSEFLEGEIENGVDDNGNGLVDERGFTVERVGESFVVRLTLQRMVNGGRLQTRTGRTSTKPRNRLEQGGD